MSDKIRTKRFWISLVGMVIMLLELFGVRVDAPYVNEIVSSVCAVCVLCGLLDGGSKTEAQNSENGESDKTEEGEESKETNDK